jgi:RHS repeat-associated protein
VVVPLAGRPFGKLRASLGTVRQLADADDWVVLPQSFELFDDLMEREGDAFCVYGFTGEQVDGTGLVYLRARYLDTDLGRFLIKDNWYGNKLRPNTKNKYVYVLNNPVLLIDTSGICFMGNDVWPYDINPCTPEDKAIQGAYE